MINDEFRNLISKKIRSLEEEKRKLQITQDSEKLEQVESQQQTLHTMIDYPISFASIKSSDEEIQSIINLYITDVENELGKTSKEIDELMEKWTNVDFLNEISAYSILNMIMSNNSPGLANYWNLLANSRNNADNLNDRKSIYQIIISKFPKFPPIIDLVNRENMREIVVQNVKDVENFKSKFDKEIVEYYTRFVVRDGKILLPFSEEVRVTLSKHMAPLLAKANSLKLKLEYYKNIDLKDENSKRKVLEEIMENIYYTRSQQLPFYASYDLNKIDKLIAITNKISNVSDKELLMKEIKAYKKQLENKSQYIEKKEHQSEYQTKYDRFKSINQMLHMGDYSEGDTNDYFSVFLYHTLNQMKLPFCNKCEYIDKLIKRQFGSFGYNESLVEEVKQKLETSVEKSGIISQIEQYKKLSKSLVSQMHKKKIKTLEEEIKNKIASIVMSVRNSYAKEGYQLYKGLPFLKLSKSMSCKIPEQSSLEEIIEKDNNKLFNANYIIVTNTMGNTFDKDGSTFNDVMGLSQENKSDYADKMQQIHGNINQMVGSSLKEEEILFLCGLSETQLSQITEEKALFKMQTLREIMTKYSELDDKTLANNDYKDEQPRFGR